MVLFFCSSFTHTQQHLVLQVALISFRVSPAGLPLVLPRRTPAVGLQALPQTDLRGDPGVILEGLLHDAHRCVFVCISNKNSIMDGQRNNTLAPEGFQNPHKDIRLRAEELHA